jgi:putative ABC transport system permease protein
MITLWQDIVYGARMLLKKPGFTAVAALSLALGIAVNTIVFTLIDTTLLRPLDFRDPGKLMVVWTVPLQRPDQNNNPNVSTYFAIRDRSKSFETVGAMNGAVANIGAEQDGSPAERINGQIFSPSMFKVIGVRPAMGRFFNDSEDQVDNSAPVIVISHRYWVSHFHSDPNVLGKTLVMDKAPHTVIGVMPEGFSFFNDSADYWAPLGIDRLKALSKQGFLVVVGRLKEGVSIKQAQAEMTAIAAQLASGDPERNQGKGARVESLQEAAYGELRNPLLTLQGAVAFVLLIGCANVAGLMLARAASRRTEMAIRTAVGAGRARIVRQLITESLPLSLLGGLLGLFLAWGGLRLFVALAPPGFPRLNQLSLDGTVLAFTTILAVLTAVIFGIAPAIQASKPNLVHSLKESGRSGTDSVARQHMRSALVALQIGLALVLLIGAGLMINSFMRVQNTSLGADPTGLLVFQFRFSQDETIKPYSRFRGMGLWDVLPQPGLEFDQVLDRMRAVPGVVSAAATSRQPLDGGGTNMQFLIEGRPAPPPSATGPQGRGQTANYFAVSPGFFGTMRIPILRGRDFTRQDNAAGPPVIIINQTLAKRFFPGENPVGKIITLDFVPDEPARQIIAVVGDTVLNRLQRQQAPILYVPEDQQTPRWEGPSWNDRAAMTFILRTTGDPMSLAPAVRHAVAEVDPNKPAADIRLLQKDLDQQVQYVRLYMALLGVFGGVAAVLAAIGIYGVMAYSVAERTREIGIRMALGAGGRQVLGLVARQALILVSIGLVLGLAGSFALTRLIKSALYGVTATDPMTYVAVSLLLTLVAIAACVLPARRAVGVDPTVALRYE